MLDVVERQAGEQGRLRVGLRDDEPADGCPGEYSAEKGGLEWLDLPGLAGIEEEGRRPAAEVRDGERGARDNGSGRGSTCESGRARGSGDGAHDAATGCLSPD